MLIALLLVAQVATATVTYSSEKPQLMLSEEQAELISRGTVEHAYGAAFIVGGAGLAIGAAYLVAKDLDSKTASTITPLGLGLGGAVAIVIGFVLHGMGSNAIERARITPAGS